MQPGDHDEYKATHMGKLQLHEDELAFLLDIVGYADDGVHFQQEEYQAVIRRIRDAAAR